MKYPTYPLIIVISSLIIAHWMLMQKVVIKLTK